MRRTPAGFTLLEVLTVLAILGIVGGIFGWNLMRVLRQNELRDAAYQLVTELRRARGNTQKTGVATQVALQADPTSYAVSVSGGVPDVQRLPHGVKVNPAVTGSDVQYQPPFGTLDGSGVVWKLQSPADESLNLYVKVVGITGKVMISATQN